MPAVELPSRNSASVSLASRPKRRWMAIEMHGADRPGDEGEREDRERVQRAVEALLEREEHRREHQHRGDAVDEEVEIFGGAADDHADGDLAGGDVRVVVAILPGATFGRVRQPVVTCVLMLDVVIACCNSDVTSRRDA